MFWRKRVGGQQRNVIIVALCARDDHSDVSITCIICMCVWCVCTSYRRTRVWCDDHGYTRRLISCETAPSVWQSTMSVNARRRRTRSTYQRRFARPFWRLSCHFGPARVTRRRMTARERAISSRYYYYYYCFDLHHIRFTFRCDDCDVHTMTSRYTLCFFALIIPSYSRPSTNAPTDWN